MTAPQHDPTASRIRNLVVDRMLRMNARHATHAWLQRRMQSVGPHGLAFLYSDPAPDGPYHRVAAATRLVADADDVRDLPRLLYRLTSLARERYAGEPGGFDPRTSMTNRRDAMSPRSVYIGVGVSSLDTPAGAWQRTQNEAGGPLDIAGRCFVVLVDGTAMLIDRGGQDVYGEVRVQCTHDLNVEPGLAARRWSWNPDLYSVDGTIEVWQRLYGLHELAARRRLSPRSA